MVNTAEIQVSLRAHLYGIRRLPNGDPTQLKTLDSAADFTSKEMIGRLSEMQRLIELDTYVRVPNSFSEFETVDRIVDVQDKEAFSIHSDLDCCFLQYSDSEMTVIARNFPSSSIFTWCPEDGVVVEAYGYVLIVPLFFACS
jgi:hypothetical protein